MSPSRLVCVSLLLAACSGAPAPARPADPPAATAPAAAPTLTEIEAALLATPAWRVHVAVVSEGAFPAELFGNVIATADNRVRIHMRGAFAGKPVEILWVSDGTRTSTGVDTPPHTTEAIVIGLTRMGLLHNLAGFLMGQPVPDHAAGGVADWVRVVDERAPAPGEVTYQLEVDGKGAADVTLAVARAPTGPVMTRRAITVHFDGGDMKVVEDYTFELGTTADADAFTLPARP